MSDTPALPEPVAWRYEDARGLFRYRGFVPNFDTEYTTLKPVALYTANQLRAALAAQAEAHAAELARLQSATENALRLVDINQRRTARDDAELDRLTAERNALKKANDELNAELLRLGAKE